MGTESVSRGRGDAAEGELDLPGIWNAIVRRKKLIAGVTILCFAGALAFVTLAKPRYTGEAKVLVENQENYFTKPATGAVPEPVPDSEAVASQVQLVTSRDLAREAIRELGLKGNPEFDPLAGSGGMLRRILSLVGISRSRTHLSPEDRILESYFDRLMVFAVPKSRVLTIQFSAQDPALAKRGANTIARLYIGVQQKAKRERASLAAKSLGALVADLRNKLAVAEGKVEDFRTRSGLLVGSNNTAIPNQQLGEINAQLAAAQTAKADAQAKARLIRSLIRRGRLGELSDVARDQLVQRIGQQAATLRAQIASESRTLGPAHPRMKQMRAQLASINNQLRGAALKVARGLENDARIAGVRVDNLQAAIESQKRNVGNKGADQVRLRELELEARLIKEQLETNTKKYRDALAREQSLSTPGDARIISRAVEPEKPSYPKKLPILIFATIAGFVLSAGYVIAAELLSGRAFVPARDGDIHPRDIPREIVPVAFADTGATQPDLAGEGNAVSKPGQRGDAAGDSDAGKDAASPGLALAPALQRVVSHLADADTFGYARRVLVAASAPSIDVIDAIEPVARELAGRKRAVLVDFSGDIHCPDAGLSELLAGECSFSKVIERDQVSRLHLIGRGNLGIAFDEDLDAIIDALSQTYELVFLTVPANDVHGVTLALAPAADVALVVTPDVAAGDDGLSARESLKQAGVGEVLFMPGNTAGQRARLASDRSAA